MQISYCTNIHPSHTWEETRIAVSSCAPRILKEIYGSAENAENTPLGLGLRLSADAARYLINNPEEIRSFKTWLDENNCHVETINGFPYGDFYGNSIKENVFRPDWSTQERLNYTRQLAEILSVLMPDHLHMASISTVPVSHSSFPVDEQELVAQLDHMCSFLHFFEEKTGKRIVLGFEPEPLGWLDSTQGVIDFFRKLRNASLNPDLIDRYLGITYDTCHFAIMGESPSSTLSSWRKEGIMIHKIQFSNALKLCPSGISELDCLNEFAEPVYSHQTSIFLQNQKLLLFADLPEALSWARKHMEDGIDQSEWRVHYHIPLFSAPLPPLDNTDEYNRETIMWLMKQEGYPLPQLEIETYTWSVLPPSLRQKDQPSQIAEELKWLKSCIGKESLHRTDSVFSFE